MASQKGQVTLRTADCANIFDRDSKESLVYVDMENKRAVEDAIFYYDFTDCDQFRLD